MTYWRSVRPRGLLLRIFRHHAGGITLTSTDSNAITRDETAVILRSDSIPTLVAGDGEVTLSEVREK